MMGLKGINSGKMENPQKAIFALFLSENIDSGSEPIAQTKSEWGTGIY